MDRSSSTAGKEGSGSRPRVPATLGVRAPIESPAVPAPAKPPAYGNGSGNGHGTAPGTASTSRSRIDERRASPAPRPPDAQAPTQTPRAQSARTRPALLLFILVETFLDMVAIASAFGLAYWLRFESDIFRRFVAPDRVTYLTMLSVTVATIIVTFYFSKLYNVRRGASRVDEFYRIAGAVSMGTVLSLATNSLMLADRFVYSRQILLMGWVLAIVFVTLMRVLFGALMGELHRRGVDRRRVVIVGTGPTAAMVIDRLEYHRRLGFEVVGAIDVAADGQVQGSTFVPRERIIGNLDQLTTIVQRRAIDEVIMAVSGKSDLELRDIISRLQDEHVSAKIYPDAFQLMTEYEVSVGELSGLPLLNVKDVALRGWNRILKRTFDVVFSAIVLVLTAPVMLLIALAIKMSSPGPVFFIQDRVGLDGKPFPLVKFRTMRVEGNERNAGAGADWTVENDPRRTSIGTFLRRFSLDELPQFYNVLIGEMSVVGPRPEQPKYVEEFQQRLPSYARRHREKAGITGWAQVNGLRGDTPIEWRTAADIYYVENWSFLFDLKIIARTVWSMFHGKNAY